MEPDKFILVIWSDDQKDNSGDEADQITQGAGNVLAHPRGRSS
jgi:hypothetical protein